MTTSQIHIVRAIRQLALEHRPVCIHSSLRSFGGIDGGPRTIIDAFLTEGATIIVPTFSWQFSAIPPNDQRPQRNGADNFMGLLCRVGAVRFTRPHEQRCMTRALKKTSMSALWGRSGWLY